MMLCNLGNKIIKYLVNIWQLGRFERSFTRLPYYVDGGLTFILKLPKFSLVN